MDIENFLPNYPGIDSRQFYQELYDKREFRELDPEKPRVDPTYLNHQLYIQRFLNHVTPYSSILLYHRMGLGKSRTCIGIIEENVRNGIYKGAVIISPSLKTAQNFMNEFVQTYPERYYIPKSKSEKGKVIEQGKINIKKQYMFSTYITFANKEMDGQNYDNYIFVLDEAHNLITEQKEDIKPLYPKYLKFLMNLKNCKVILATGTPMVNDIREFFPLMNMILPPNKQFPLMKDAETYIKNNTDEFRQKIRGYVSFLQEKTDIQVIDEGEKLAPLTYFYVYPVTMQADQLDGYKIAYKEDTNSEDNKNESKGDTASFYLRSRQASLISYDKKYGTKLDDSDVRKLLHEIRNAGSSSEKISVIRKYSAKFADMIEKIQKTDGISFVFSPLISKALDIFISCLAILNIQYQDLTESKTKKTASDIRKRIIELNRPENAHGQKYKVVIGSESISEGFSFKNVINIFILSPFFNFSRIEQAIFRAIRYGSHAYLINEHKQNPTKYSMPVVRIYKYVCISESVKSVDLEIYKMAEIKDIKIQKLNRLLMEMAIDCMTFKSQNYNKLSSDGSRNCQYQVCNYKCHGITETDNKLDENTYNLYYLGTHNKELYLKYYRKLSSNEKLPVITNHLSKFDMIIFYVANLFRNNFRLHLTDIYTDAFTPNNMLTVLDYMISTHLPLVNRYGYDSYLREKNNLYYLTSTYTENDFDDTYYNEFISMSNQMSVVDVTLKLMFENDRFDVLDSPFFDMETKCKIIEMLLQRTKFQSKLKPLFGDKFEVLPNNHIVLYITKPLYHDGVTWAWPPKNKIQLTNPKLKVVEIAYLYDTNNYSNYSKNVFKLKSGVYIEYDGIKLYKDRLGWYYENNTILSEYRKMAVQETMNVKGRYFGTYNSLDSTGKPNKFCIVDKQLLEHKDSRKRSTGRVCDIKSITDELLDELDIERGGQTIASLCNTIYTKLKKDNKIKQDESCGTSFKRKKSEGVVDDKLKKKYIVISKKDGTTTIHSILVENDKGKQNEKGSIYFNTITNKIDKINIRKSNFVYITVILNKMNTVYNLRDIQTSYLPDKDSDEFIAYKRAGFKQPSIEAKYLVYKFG